MSNISGTEIVLIETCITIIIWLLVIYHTLYNDQPRTLYLMANKILCRCLLLLFQKYPNHDDFKVWD